MSQENISVPSWHFTYYHLLKPCERDENSSLELGRVRPAAHGAVTANR